MENEIELVRESVAALPKPDFVHGFELRLGQTWDGDPGLWVTFHVGPIEPSTPEAMVERADALATFGTRVVDRLLPVSETRYPYVRFRDEVAVAAQ